MRLNVNPPFPIKPHIQPRTLRGYLPVSHMPTDNVNFFCRVQDGEVSPSLLAVRPGIIPVFRFTPQDGPVVLKGEAGL